MNEIISVALDRKTLQSWDQKLHPSTFIKTSYRHAKLFIPSFLNSKSSAFQLNYFLPSRGKPGTEDPNSHGPFGLVKHPNIKTKCQTKKKKKKHKFRFLVLQNPIFSIPCLIWLSKSTWLRNQA